MCAAHAVFRASTALGPGLHGFNEDAGEEDVGSHMCGLQGRRFCKMRGSLANEAQSRRGRKKCAFEDLGLIHIYVKLKRGT